LADIAHHISSLLREANSYLRDPNYGALRLRLENAHAAMEAAASTAAAVEARRRVRMNEKDERSSRPLESGRDRRVRGITRRDPPRPLPYPEAMNPR
jgi:hypothetical protein